MASENVILVDIVGLAIADMQVQIPMNYEPGRSSQILKQLYEYDTSQDFKDLKYPLAAMLMPTKVERGGSIGVYGIARIERIVIATITNSTDSVLKRYQVGGTFKSILYPYYYEFLNAIGRSIYISGEDPESFKHTVLDVPGVQPLGQGLVDYIDALEILNLELPLNQIKTC